MGAKTRGNWQLRFCLRTDCRHRDKRCDRCFQFSEYEGKGSRRGAEAQRGAANVGAETSRR